MQIKSESGGMTLSITDVETIGVADVDGVHKVIIYPKNPVALSIPDVDLVTTKGQQGFFESSHDDLESAKEHAGNLHNEVGQKTQQAMISQYMKKRKR